MKINDRQFGAAVRRLRKRRGWTQQQLASAAGVAPNTIAIVERGERSVTMRIVNRLAKAFRLPAPCLIVLGTDLSAVESSRRPDRLFAALKELINSVFDADTAISESRIAPRASRSRRKVRSVAP